MMETDSISLSAESDLSKKSLKFKLKEVKEKGSGSEPSQQQQTSIKQEKVHQEQTSSISHTLASEPTTIRVNENREQT